MFNRRAARFRRIGSRLLGLGLAVLLLLLSVLSASDLLHRYFHHPERQGGGACAVCLLLKGHLESPAFAPALPISRPQRVNAPLCADLIQRFTFLSAPSRAPPASTALLSVAF